MSETQDVDALRARIAELEAQLAAAGPRPPAAPEEPHHARGLSVVAGVLVVLACVLGTAVRHVGVGQPRSCPTPTST